MERKRLTEMAIAKAKPPAMGYIWRPDPLLPSFGIRIYATGSRSWGITRREPGGKHPVFRRIGQWPAMTLADARTEARKRLAGEATAPVKLGKAIEEFLVHAKTRTGQDLRQTTIDQYRRNLSRYAAPLLNRRFAEITRREVAQLLGNIARTSGGPTASLVRAMLARLWSWGVSVGYLEHSMVAGVPAYAVPKRSRVLSDAELRAIWQATEAASVYHLIVRLMLWTGCRRSEAGGMAWSELHDGVWIIPGPRTKNHRELVLPIARQTVAELQQWPRIAGQDLLFSTRGSAGFGAWSAGKRELDTQVRLNRAWVVHDIRRTVQTRFAAIGINRDVANRVLNHAVGPIDAAYDHHDYFEEKRAALQRWADELQKIVM